MIAFEWFFFAGLAIGFISSRRYVPREQHDARGAAMLICMAVALGSGWLQVAIGVPVEIALPTAVIATSFVARATARRVRHPGSDGHLPVARHADLTRRVRNS